MERVRKENRGDRSGAGGKREGAGRPKTKEDTKVMRIPLSLVKKVEAMIKHHSGGSASRSTSL